MLPFELWNGFRLHLLRSVWRNPKWLLLWLQAKQNHNELFEIGWISLHPIDVLYLYAAVANEIVFVSAYLYECWGREKKALKKFRLSKHRIQFQISFETHQMVDIFKWICYFCVAHYKNIIYILNCFKGFERQLCCWCFFHVCFVAAVSFFNLMLDMVCESTNFHHNRTDSEK